MINQKFKVFAFTFLLLSITIFSTMQFVHADGPLDIPKNSTLTISDLQNYDGLIIHNDATLIIANTGNLSTTGNFQNHGTLIVDGNYQHNGFLWNFEFGHIFEGCGTVNNQVNIVYIMAGNGIENAECNDGSNVLPDEEDMIVDANSTFTVEQNKILNLFGNVIIRGTFVNLGDVLNSATILMDGGSFKNVGNITHLCENFGISKFTGSASIQNVGSVGETICIPPDAVDDDYSVDEDQKLTVGAPGVLQNDDDVNNAGLIASVTITPTNPEFGTLEFDDDGSFTYTPNDDFFGEDSFDYEIIDGFGGADTATVTIEVKPVDDPPIAIDDFYSTSENTILIIDVPGVLENDDDVNNTMELIASVTITPTNPEFGTLEFDDDGSFTYTPNDDFFGEDSFEYEITDGRGNIGLAPATVTIEISEEDPPIAIDDFFSTREGEELIIDAPGVLQNDDDVNNAGLTASNISNPASGILEFQSNGSFVYTSSDTFLGTDSFEYQITDGHGNIGLIPATVTIEVIEVTDVPIAIDDFYSTSENTMMAMDVPGVLQNDVDVNNVGLTASVTITPTNPEFGTLEFDDEGSFTYTPNDHFFGDDSFDYEITDRFGGVDIATVTIEITKVIDDSLQEQKIDKIIELDNLSDEASEKYTEDEIKKAIKDLTKSVESKKWEDNGNYLIKNEGSDVFNKQQKGVKHIIHILDEDKESGEFLSKIISIALDLVDIDNKLATNEFIIAEKSPDSEQECLDDAEKEYEKSDSELEKGKYDKAIDHLGHLWEKSLKCQGIDIGSSDSSHGPGRK